MESGWITCDTWRGTLPRRRGKLGLLKPLSSHRRRVPSASLHIARLQTTLAEDCGACVQIELNMARKAGVPHEILSAVIGQRPEDLPEDLADVARFSWAIVERARDEDHLRTRIRNRYGEEGLIEISLAIASARLFPTIRRAMGFSKSCALTPLNIPA